jgi:hypothetical protein
VRGAVVDMQGACAAVGEGVGDAEVHTGGDGRRCGCESPRLTASNRRLA